MSEAAFVPPPLPGDGPFPWGRLDDAWLACGWHGLPEGWRIGVHPLMLKEFRSDLSERLAPVVQTDPESDSFAHFGRELVALEDIPYGTFVTLPPDQDRT